MVSPSKQGPRQARIAFHLSLWPLVFLLSLFMVSFFLLLAIMLDGETFRTLAGPVLIFLVFQVTKNPLLGFILLFSIFGTVMGIGVKAWKVDEKTNRIAARAGLLGFAGIAVYALLVWFWSGFGR